MGQLGQSDTGKDRLDRTAGSIRLRVQWVHDYVGLLDYYLSCSERRLATLGRSKEGMMRQLKSLKDTAKQKEEHEEPPALAAMPPALTAMYERKKGYREARMDSTGAIVKEEKTFHVTKGVLRPSNWKNAMSAARFIGAAKKSAKLGVGRTRSSHCGVIKLSSDGQLGGELDDLYVEDGSFSDEMFDSVRSSEIPLNEYLSRIRRYSESSNENLRAQGTLYSNKNSLSSLKIPVSLIIPSNTRLLGLRWQCWSASHHTNTEPSLPCPHVYPSWHISRAFINCNGSKVHHSKVNADTLHDETSDQGKSQRM